MNVKVELPDGRVVSKPFNELQPDDMVVFDDSDRGPISMTTDTTTELRARIASLEAELVAARANQKLAAFGAWAAREFRDTLSDVDGGSAQEQMERTGVIVKREVADKGPGAMLVVYLSLAPKRCISSWAPETTRPGSEKNEGCAKSTYERLAQSTWLAPCEPAGPQ